jgi:PAS domain S-box-containing protein
VENLNDSLFIYDFNGTILDVNENTCKMFGYNRDELIGANLRKISTKKASQERELQFLKLDKEDSKTFDSEGVRKDGVIIPISESIKIVSTEGNGKIQSFVRDITERKKGEKLLKFNKERLETLVQINQMYEFSAEEISDYVLEKAVELTGSTLGLINYVGEDSGIAAPSLWSKSVIKKPEDEKPEHFLIKNTEIWAEVFRKKTPIIINDYSLSRPTQKDCLEEYMELRRLLVVPVTDEGNIVLLSAVANKEEDYDETDVNELTLLMDGMRNHIKAKLAAEELQKAKEKAEAANIQLRELNASKDTFFSIIAHDLRGPLSSLHELTQLIEENLDSYSQDDLKELIVFQKTAAEILYKLLENLLTWSRVQRGMIVYQPQHIDIKWLVDRAVDLLNMQAEGKQITLKNLIHEQIFIYADVNMVDTVIRNLISNALKFTHSGGTVEISAQQDDHKIEMTVSDTGVGIEAENLQKLFRIDARYKRAGTAQEEGTGLGLILCKEFIERHNGKIWVESQVDKGSVFRFTLPKNLKEDSS